VVSGISCRAAAANAEVSSELHGSKPHGHARVFSWIDSFRLGSGLYSIPRLKVSADRVNPWQPAFRSSSLTRKVRRLAPAVFLFGRDVCGDVSLVSIHNLPLLR